MATFEEPEETKESPSATPIVANATIFTEGLLRNILDLTPEQQLELAASATTSVKFRRSAEFELQWWRSAGA